MRDPCIKCSSRIWAGSPHDRYVCSNSPVPGSAALLAFLRISGLDGCQDVRINGGTCGKNDCATTFGTICQMLQHPRSGREMLRAGGTPLHIYEGAARANNLVYSVGMNSEGLLGMEGAVAERTWPRSRRCQNRRLALDCMFRDHRLGDCRSHGALKVMWRRARRLPSSRCGG